MGTRPPSQWPLSPRKRAGSDRSLHSPLHGLCATLKDTLDAHVIFLKKLSFLITQVWFCCNCSSSIKERKEERGGSIKTKENNGTEAHERLWIFRGRAQPSKGVTEYMRPLQHCMWSICRDWREYGNQLESDFHSLTKLCSKSPTCHYTLQFLCHYHNGDFLVHTKFETGKNLLK